MAATPAAARATPPPPKARVPRRRHGTMGGATGPAHGLSSTPAPTACCSARTRALHLRALALRLSSTQRPLSAPVLSPANRPVPSAQPPALLPVCRGSYLSVPGPESTLTQEPRVALTHSSFTPNALPGLPINQHTQVTEASSPQWVPGSHTLEPHRHKHNCPQMFFIPYCSLGQQHHCLIFQDHRHPPTSHSGTGDGTQERSTIDLHPQPFLF